MNERTNERVLFSSPPRCARLVRLAARAARVKTSSAHVRVWWGDRLLGRTDALADAHPVWNVVHEVCLNDSKQAKTRQSRHLHEVGSWSGESSGGGARHRMRRGRPHGPTTCVAWRRISSGDGASREDKNKNKTNKTNNPKKILTSNHSAGNGCVYICIYDAPAEVTVFPRSDVARGAALLLEVCGGGRNVGRGGSFSLARNQYERKPATPLGVVAAASRRAERSWLGGG